MSNDPLETADGEGAVRCALAIEARTDGVRKVVFDVGSIRLSLSAAEARELADDLVRFALEAEEGGRSQDTIGGWAVARDEMPTERDIRTNE